MYTRGHNNFPSLLFSITIILHHYYRVYEEAQGKLNFSIHYLVCLVRAPLVWGSFYPVRTQKTQKIGTKAGSESKTEEVEEGAGG